jgi:hypothetical protein
VSFLHTFAVQTLEDLALTTAAAERLRALHDLDGRIHDDTPNDVRLSLVHGILDGTRPLLGEDDYAHYRASLNRVVAELLLGAPADSPAERGF